MIIKNKLEIDLARRGVTPRLDAVQNDANARSVEISLLENGSEWTVPDGVSAAVSYVKPDGTSGLYDTLPNAMQAVEISGSTIKFTMAPQMLTVPGLVRAVVVLIKDTEQLSTFPLDVHVIAQPGAGAEKSENYYHYKTFGDLHDAIGLLKELKTEDKSSLVAAVNEVARKAGGSGGGSGGEVFVPKAQVTQTANGATITITDQHGTSEATVNHGKDGKPGVYILAEGETIADAPADADVVIDPAGTPDVDLSDYAKTEDIPTDAHINNLINTALGVIENGSY